MDSAGAYGAGGASGEFDIKSFLSKPQVILRLLGWVFAVVVFGCVSASKDGNGRCYYDNKDYSVCGYGIAVGVIAFLGLMVFVVFDAIFDNISNILHRKYIVLADIGFSGLWTFMWFVCFCLLADKWRKNGIEYHDSKSNPEAAIAFSFFSILIFIALTVLAGRKYKQGIGSDFQSGYDPDIFGEGDRGAPYSGPSDTYQGSGEYRQSPFVDPSTVVDKPAPAAGGYQQSY